MTASLQACGTVPVLRPSLNSCSSFFLLRGPRCRSIYLLCCQDQRPFLALALLKYSLVHWWQTESSLLVLPGGQGWYAVLPWFLFSCLWEPVNHRSLQIVWPECWLPTCGFPSCSRIICELFWLLVIKSCHEVPELLAVLVKVELLSLFMPGFACLLDECSLVFCRCCLQGDVFFWGALFNYTVHKKKRIFICL